MERPARAIGISWHTSENYDACLRVMSDRESLPTEYSCWLEYAEAVAQRIEGAGAQAIRVFINPVEFPLWCRARALQPDALARERFATSVALREVSGTVKGFRSLNTFRVLSRLLFERGPHS